MYVYVLCPPIWNCSQTRGRNRELFSRDIRDMLVTFFEMIKFQFPQSDVVAPRSVSEICNV